MNINIKYSYAEIGRLKRPDLVTGKHMTGRDELARPHLEYHRG